LVQIQSYSHENGESAKENAAKDQALHAKTHHVILEHREEDELRHVETQDAIKVHREEDDAWHAELHAAILAHRKEDNLRHAEIRDAIMSHPDTSCRAHSDYIPSSGDDSTDHLDDKGHSDASLNQAHDDSRNRLSTHAPRRRRENDVHSSLSSVEPRSRLRERQLRTNEGITAIFHDYTYI
jgi:hypothetical protein